MPNITPGDTSGHTAAHAPVAARSQWRQNVALLLGALALCWIVAELTLRAYYGHPPPFRYPQVRHVRTSYGFKPEPNQRTFTTHAPVVTNSLGFRDDHEWQVPKPPGLLRVMTLGDSFTFGNTVAVEESYPQLLEQHLRQHHGDVEVVNASAGGWGLAIETGFFRTEGFALDPEILLLGFFANDWVDPEMPAHQLTDDGRLDARPWWAKWVDYRTLFLIKRSAFIRWTRDRIGAARSGENFLSHLLSNKIDLDRDPFVAATYKTLRQLKSMCDQRDIPLIITAIPPINYFWRADGSPPQYVDHLRRFAQAQGITFLDLAEGFRAVQDTDVLYLHPWDDHLSPDGHRLVAAQLAPVISRLTRARRERGAAPTR